MVRDTAFDSPRSGRQSLAQGASPGKAESLTVSFSPARGGRIFPHQGASFAPLGLHADARPPPRAGAQGWRPGLNSFGPPGPYPDVSYARKSGTDQEKAPSLTPVSRTLRN